MLQGDPFFSSPQIFFGKADREEEEEEMEWNFADLINTSLQANLPEVDPKNGIGLFFHWFHFPE
jgi:hypothetical protein